MMTLGQRIQQLRLRQGLSQTALAGLTGYRGKSMISRIENGSATLSFEKIPEFAKALHTSTEYLLGISNDPDTASYKKQFLSWLDEKITESDSKNSQRHIITVPFTQSSDMNQITVWFTEKDDLVFMRSIPLSNDILTILDPSASTDTLRDIRLLYGARLLESNELEISGPMKDFPQLLLRLIQAILYLDAKAS